MQAPLLDSPEHPAYETNPLAFSMKGSEKDAPKRLKDLVDVFKEHTYFGTITRAINKKSDFWVLTSLVHEQARRLGCDKKPPEESPESRRQWELFNCVVLANELVAKARPHRLYGYKILMDEVRKQINEPIPANEPLEQMHLFRNWDTLQAKLQVNPQLMLQVKELHFENKDLYFLSHAVGGLTCLEKIYLNNNHLETLPESLKSLQHLELIDVRGNKMSLIPEELKKKKVKILL